MDSFFKDKHDHYALWQTPNVPLIGWAILRVASWLAPVGHFKTGTGQLSKAFLFTWAFLELTDGASYFRRALGAVVMLMLAVGFLT